MQVALKQVTNITFIDQKMQVSIDRRVFSNHYGPGRIKENGIFQYIYLRGGVIRQEAYIWASITKQSKTPSRIVATHRPAP